MNTIKGAKRMMAFDKPTVWSVFTPLAVQTKSINLGQGFPNWQPPDFFLKALKSREETGYHQYTRAYGHLPLVNTISKFYSPIFNRKIDAMTEVSVGCGGVSVLCAAFVSLVDPGDEVVLLDPSYDCYRAQITIAGGISRSVPLKPRKINSLESLKKRENLSKFTQDDVWQVDWELLEQSINEKTKILLINTPHNPSGKVFTVEELERIAGILKQFPRVVVVEDGVYEHITFDNDPFQLQRFANMKDTWDRTVSVYSAGKLFSATGSRIGWAIGPSNLIRQLNAYQQYNNFCLYGPLQEAVADSLEYSLTHDYFFELREKYSKLKELLMKQLIDSQLNLNLWIPEGGYFVLADISNQVVMDKYKKDEKTGETYTQDYAFCIQLAQERGVVAIPCSVFYGEENQHVGENLIRFAFCKVEDDILQAGQRLKA